MSIYIKALLDMDALVMSQILPGRSEYGAFEGHRKEDVTSKVSDPPFVNFD